MPTYIREIRKASHKTIDDLARIHLQSFDGFFLSFMGKGFLKKMYQSYIEHEKSGILVALEGGEIVGLLAYSYDMDGLYKFMARKHTFAFARSIVVPMVKKPRIVIEKIKRFFVKEKNYPVGMAEENTEANSTSGILKLSSLCVLPSHQRRGIGTELVKNFVMAKVKSKTEIEINYQLSLDTDEINNDEVLKFYKNNGFVEKRHFETPDGRKMIEFTLA